jgi:hypothetical protein
MRFAKLLLVSCAVVLLAGAVFHERAAANGKGVELRLKADGGAPLQQPPQFLDGDPLPRPPLVADGGDPLPRPPLVADGGDPLPRPPLVADGGDPLPRPPAA